MNRKTKKGKNIKLLISKATLAQKEGFYLETIFLCHSIIEERLRSTILKTDIKFGNRNKIPGCIKRFKKNIKQENYLFEKFFTQEILNKIKTWKKSKRDNLIHELEKNYDIINNETELEEIAESGMNLMKELSSAVMRWKKQAKKQI